MHLNIVKSKNAKQYYVLEGYRKPDGKDSTRIVRKLGTHEQLLKEHPDPCSGRVKRATPEPGGKGQIQPIRNGQNSR